VSAATAQVLILLARDAASVMRAREFALISHVTHGHFTLPRHAQAQTRLHYDSSPPMKASKDVLLPLSPCCQRIAKSALVAWRYARRYSHMQEAQMARRVPRHLRAAGRYAPAIAARFAL
jgi:hypothetical protein